MRNLAGILPWMCLALASRSPAADTPFVAVDPAATTALRLRGTDRPFVAVGVNYFDHETGWAPRLWQRFDEARVRRHLQLLREQGFNTIRVFLTFESFHREPGKVDAGGMEKFRRLLALCREFGIYVIPSGPDHWEGRPAWRQAVPYADEAMLRADEVWWGEFAALCRNEPTVLAYDLYNEPMIGWDSFGMLDKWRRWLSSTYGSVEATAKAWNVPVASLPPLDRTEIPPAKPSRGDARLFDYQRFRESIGDEWTRRLAAAIRSADRNHLVTIGHIQWAAPIKLAAEVKHYAGFNLASNAKLLDFVTIHFYPMDEPPPFAGPEGFAANAAYLEAVLFQASVGKPLMIGEFGWYGGGALVVDGREVYPDRPISHQLEWNRLFLEVSRGRVCGWLNWAFADPPEARDLSRWSGCWTTDLALKPWGEEFGRFARDVTRKPQEPREAPAWLRSFEFDRKALVTDPQAGAEARLELRRRRAVIPQHSTP